MKRAIFALSILAMAAGTSATGNTGSEATDDVICNAPDGWQEVAAEEPAFVVFGELHGTREGPAFVGNLACALSSKGERVLLAIEHNAFQDPALQKAWAAPHAQFTIDLGSTGWAGRNDGVGSEAMFAMLVGLHALKERGLPISVVAFNGARDEEQFQRLAHLPGQGGHEAAQAENIAEAAAAADYDRVLVLVGSFHARKDVAQMGPDEVEPMARRLARSGRTISLEMAFGAGSSWGCRLKPGFRPAPGEPLLEGSMDCSNQESQGNADYSRAPFIELGGSLGERSFGEFDGFYWLGPIHGSPPAIPAN
jgi:hypothetical protein